MDVSLKESEEIFLRLDFCFSSSIFFLIYYSDSYFGSSIFGAWGSSLKPKLFLVLVLDY